MPDLFGTMDVHIIAIEWDSDMELQLAVTTTGPNETPTFAAEKLARDMVREHMALTVDNYDPDGCREFVMSDNLVDLITPAEWLEELREKTTVPWVTIETHTIPIQ